MAHEAAALSQRDGGFGGEGRGGNKMPYDDFVQVTANRLWQGHLHWAIASQGCSWAASPHCANIAF